MASLADLPTPQVVVDRSRLVNNIERVQQLASAGEMRLRPHAKTHKSPFVAKMQIDRGAFGICCAKVGEAEVFAAAGVSDIRLPYPVNPSNAPRILALMDRAAISIIVDHLDVARGWSDDMQRANRTLDVLVKVDVGFHRCGIDPGAAALTFIKKIAGMRGLRLRGLLSHAGHGYHATSDVELEAIAREEAETLLRVQDEAARAGIALDEISVGATPTLRFSAKQRGITELRPGNYVYFDRTQVALGAATLDDCALTVLATVVSTPAPDRIIFDSGSKTLTNDQARGFAPVDGYGAVLSDEGRIDESLTIVRLSEEHATVRVNGTTRLRPGDRVRIVPNHSCVVSNMVDAVQLVDGDRVVDTIAVAARGKIA
ncbi:MAG TPA: alanine racemase [Vicinamibacterales bacterium]|jgi:D-serine deaminase-like pyridoxal phosphate-dependent protein